MHKALYVAHARHRTSVVVACSWINQSKMDIYKWRVWGNCATTRHRIVHCRLICRDLCFPVEKGHFVLSQRQREAEQTQMSSSTHHHLTTTSKWSTPVSVRMPITIWTDKFNRPTERVLCAIRGHFVQQLLRVHAETHRMEHFNGWAPRPTPPTSLHFTSLHSTQDHLRLGKQSSRHISSQVKSNFL